MNHWTHARGVLVQQDVYQLPPGIGSAASVVVADPWYGKIVGAHDVANVTAWIATINNLQVPDGVPIYFWGGIGKPKHRPLYEFLLALERDTDYAARDIITWRKKRGYGKQGDYLFVREECLVITRNGGPIEPFINRILMCSGAMTDIILTILHTVNTSDVLIFGKIRSYYGANSTNVTSAPTFAGCLSKSTQNPGSL